MYCLALPANVHICTVLGLTEMPEACFAGKCAYVHMADVTAGKCADLHNCVQYCTVPVHSLHRLCTYAHIPPKQALDISVRPVTVQKCTYAGNTRQYM